MMAAGRRTARRDRFLEVEPLGDGGFAFEARLTDTSSGGDHDPPTEIATIHDFRVTGEVVGPHLTLTRLHVEAPTHPYARCPAVLQVCDELVGSALGSGWRHAVLDRLRGPAGCTHIVTLLLSLTEITTLTFFLRINETVAYSEANRTSGRWMAAGVDAVPSLRGACHVLATDGPLLALARTPPPDRPADDPPDH
jgi:hypothetical protein